MWIDNGKNDVQLDGMVMGDRTCLAVSFFERSVQDVKAFGAQFILNAKKGSFVVHGEVYQRVEKGDFDVYYAKVSGHKDVFYHGLLVNRSVGNTAFICPEGEEGRMTYEYLMKNSVWPLLPEWGDALFEAARKEYCARSTRLLLRRGQNCRLEEESTFEGMAVVTVEQTLCARLPVILKKLIETGRISMGADRNQSPLNLTDMDTYFAEYGRYLVENLERKLVPRIPLNGNMENCALKKMRLYPQQAAVVNGAVATLTGKKRSGSSKYCIINGGMGTGKTIMGLSILEKYHVDKWLRQNPSKKWEDAYEREDTIAYRAIISAPGHLVEKWAKEAEEQIPYAKVVRLHQLSDLMELKLRGKKPSGREIWVISKDFAKLSYVTRPVPSIRKRGEIRRKYCTACGEPFMTPGPKCPHCGSTGHRFEKTRADGSKVLSDSDILYKATGLSCPGCGRVVPPYKALTQPSEGDPGAVLDIYDFANPTTVNQKCFYCDFEFWEPDVKPLDLAWWSEGRRERPEPKWKRITVYANEKRDSTKSVWRSTKYSRKEIEEALNEKADCSGVRKYSPAQYIKKYLNGYFDFYIADEFHLYKNTSGQGEAFAALSHASGRTLAMTGTLTGGKAEDLFYSLYRLDAKRMKEAGFAYGDTVKFSYQYGNVKTTSYYGEPDPEDEEKSISTRGRVTRSSRKVEPGISPVLFVDFLMDRTLYLDLSDMTCHLPELKETVVEVPFSEDEEELFDCYSGTLSALKAAVKDDSANFGLMGSMLQFSQSWLDRPYTEGTKYFVSPATGETVCEYPQKDAFRSREMLTSKEKALIRNVKNDLMDGRWCFIYATYTGKPDTNVAPRLKTILEQELNERVEILRSDHPAPFEREAYIHGLAREGVRVIITNPKCVETGLDFIWWEDGIEYNYPSIHCYQLNFELACVQQAIHRHLRLIQPRRCTTFFYCWKDTAQAELLRILAKKMQAAQAIQGHFSTEGLLSMAQGIDARVELARALAEKDTTSGADLQSMFDIMESDRALAGKERNRWQKMKLLCEVMGEEAFNRAFRIPSETIAVQDAFGSGDELDDEYDPEETLSAGTQIDLFS